MHTSEKEPLAADIKEGRGPGTGLAVTKHNVRPPFIAPPLGLRFATPWSHSGGLLPILLGTSTMILKASRMPFSTDYMEWGLRRAEGDREGPLELAMIVDESDEA